MRAWRRQSEAARRPKATALQASADSLGASRPRPRDDRAPSSPRSGSRSPASASPADALAAAQRDYVAEADGDLEPAAACRRPGAARSATAASPAPTGPRNPSSAFLAEMYLLNARTLLQLAKSVEGDAEDAGADPLRRAAVDRRGGAEQLPRPQPGGAEEGDRDQRREPAARPDPALERHPARPPVADRRERVRGRPQRRDDARARWSSRTSSSSCSSTRR